METQIHKLNMGVCNCYLVKQEGTVLVDAGPPNCAGRLRPALEALSISPRAISFILLTHGHWDHIGSAAAVKTLTEGKVAVNRREKEWVQFALKPLTPANGPWGVVLGVMMRLMVPRVTFPGSDVDIILEDEAFSLGPFGISGRVLHTPGHTAGSMSLLLDSGEAFVGDLAMNGLPMRIGPGMPPLAEDAVAVKQSWRLLLSHGARMIYPSHGKPFRAEALQKAL